jgi:mxaA protein
LSAINVFAAEKLTAEVAIERNWGLLLGDEFTVTAKLPVADDQLDEDSLPGSDKRYGNWLYLKQVSLEDAQLTLIYQVYNVAKQTVDITTPALRLTTVRGDSISVPEAKLTIGPLLASDAEVPSSKVQPKPDEQAQGIDTAATEDYLLLSLAVALLSLLSLVGWHIGWKPRNREPFAQALFELTMMKWTGKRDVDKASRILHQAFNRTAGTIVVYSELGGLLAAASWLNDQQQQIDKFYQKSSQRFFSRHGGDKLEFDEILSLAKSCRAREKLA